MGCQDKPLAILDLLEERRQIAAELAHADTAR
jgi:hypothetical protein